MQPSRCVLPDAVGHRYTAHSRQPMARRCEPWPSPSVRCIDDLLHTVDPGDQRPAAWAADHASRGAPGAGLHGALRRVGATGQVNTLLARDPASHVSLDKLFNVPFLLYKLRQARATGQVTTLASRAAAHASFDNPLTVAELLNSKGLPQVIGELVRPSRRGPHQRHTASKPGSKIEYRALGSHH